MDRTYGLPAGTLGALLVGASLDRGRPADPAGLAAPTSPDTAEPVIHLTRGQVRVSGPLVLS